ncbi:MAG: 2-C-methyl-D-erythritol 4-phosphate cytidylyltransferase [Planctomycetaceae bacterium]
MPKFAVILPAAGESSRFTGFRKKKPFVDLKGRAIWLRSVEHFINRDDVAEVILVLAADDREDFQTRYLANLALLEIRVVSGGTTRAASVQNGLNALQSDADFVAVHDAARPLLTAKWIDAVFAAAVEKQAAIPGLKVSSTVKEVAGDGTIQRTVDRSRLVLAQTPQVFRRELLRQAFDSAGDLSRFTDEASLVEATGHPVHVVDGWPMNIKITTADDFRAAEALLDALPRPKNLRDLHPFADDRFR